MAPRPRLSGLKLRQVTATASGPDFVLEIDAAVETISVSTGHTLRFRLADSSWPEYVPPPPVAAWLKFAHGVESRRKLPHPGPAG